MKTIIITGATSGIGRATAKKLSEQGNEIILIARDLNKGQTVAKEIQSVGKIQVFVGDLASLKSIHNVSNEILDAGITPDILINNAGGIFNNKIFTEDGFEWGFQINHLAHFYLTKRLLPEILKKPEAKIINLSSEAHKFGKIDFENLNGEKSFSGMRQYGATKLMNLLFTKSLHEKLKVSGINSYAVHPGVVRTGFGSNNTGILALFNKMPFILTPDKGAETSIFLATEKVEKLESGAYYKKSKVTPTTGQSLDLKIAEQLWNISEELLEAKGFGSRIRST